MRKTLLSLGFVEQWVNWIMYLTSSSFFSILVNVSPSPTFHSSIGIRQGYPLSHFLFILMVEGLGRSLKVATQRNELMGIITTNNHSKASHLQFVDDTLVLAKASLRETKNIKHLLLNFLIASGLSLNKDKREIFFFDTPIHL